MPEVPNGFNLLEDFSVSWFFSANVFDCVLWTCWR